MRPPVPAHSLVAFMELEFMPWGVTRKSIVDGALALTALANIPQRSIVIMPVLPDKVMLTLGGDELIFRLHSLGVFAVLHVS